MWRTYYIVQIILSVIYTGQCRKYDIESEAIKLYGEDLKSLLMRFRRTPEYMDILNDKIAELKDDFDDIVGQITFAYLGKMEKYVNETIYEEHQRKEAGRQHPGMRRADGDQETTTTTTTISTMSPVEKLDYHSPLQSRLTVTEKNFYKDIGFKYAGEAIHAIIEQALTTLNVDDSDHKSTRMVDDRKPITTTTEHVKVHEVTTESPPGDEVITIPPVHKYLYRANNETTEKQPKINNPKEQFSTTSKYKRGTKARRHADFGYKTYNEGFKANEYATGYNKQPSEQPYVKVARRQEVYGHKKPKPGVYTEDARTIGEHRGFNWW